MSELMVVWFMVIWLSFLITVTAMAVIAKPELAKIVVKELVKALKALMNGFRIR